MFCDRRNQLSNLGVTGVIFDPHWVHGSQAPEWH